jgi:hypothetical protein
VAKAGSTIPLKWRLTKLLTGQPVADAASFAGLAFTSAPCRPGSTDQIETYTASEGLKHLGDGRWQLGWKTQKSLAGRCGTLTVTFADDSTLTAAFRFT